jgi:ubiquinone/menaquinone biosynthesis C-methylase UbiE
MGLYDYFANFYDASLESMYAPYRVIAAEALSLEANSVVLDVPCGTGQSFDALTRGAGAAGVILGVDASEGMLERSRARVQARGWSNVHLVRAGAADVSLQQLQAAAGRDLKIDRLQVFLGMSVFTEPDATFQHLWDLLSPGGRCVLVDVFAERLGIQGWLVNQIARAEIRRRFWEPLERVAERFERRDLPFQKQHGGQIMLATGIKR